MRVASVCSGIGGAELAFAGLAEHVFAAEIAPFPRAVLAHHFPHLTVHGDFTEIGGDDTVDVLVGGTPCQSFSIAGLRGGMADARGNLALEFLRLAARLRTRWILWENVPGVLSSSGGRDFGAFLGGLAELGYGWSYRVLDAQFFGLAQRRKRVFVVGHLGDWRRAAAALVEPSSLRGHPSPRRETREATTGTLAARTRGGGGLGTDFDCDGGLIASAVAHSLNALSTPSWQRELSETIQRKNPRAVALPSSAVRRLTPGECEKLQGFPPGWTAIDYRGKPAADGPRYRALGNAFAVPVVRWIARRLVREHASLPLERVA